MTIAVPFSDREISVLVDVLRDWEAYPGMPDPQVYADVATALLARNLNRDQWYALESVLEVEAQERSELEWFHSVVRLARHNSAADR